MTPKPPLSEYRSQIQDDSRKLIRWAWREKGLLSPLNFSEALLVSSTILFSKMMRLTRPNVAPVEVIQTINHVVNQKYILFAVEGKEDEPGSKNAKK